MNTTLFPDDILFTQRILKAEGMYRGELDGIWGPLTEEGATAFNRKSLAIAEQRGCFDLRSEGNIATLSLDTQQQARQFMSRVQLAMTKSNSPGKSSTGPINVKIISGTRSYAEQNKLFRQGRYHNPGPVITHVRGGSSAHNFGIAWDIGIFSESRGYISEWPLYDKVAASLRSKQNIATVSLNALQEAREFMTRVQCAMSDRGPSSETTTERHITKIISGTKSYAEQNKIFRLGRYHNPGPLITNARGGNSTHNFGIAWDIGISSENKGYFPDGPLYDEVVRAGLNDALEWGGDGTQFVDKPHYQLKLTTPSCLVHKHFEAGEQYLLPA